MTLPVVILALALAGLLTGSDSLNLVATKRFSRSRRILCSWLATLATHFN